MLLVKEPNSEKLKAVAGMDENGNLKTVPPAQAHKADFMVIDKHSNALENFFTNFMRQAKEPTHFGFFKGSSDSVESNAAEIHGLLQNPQQAENKEKLDSLRLNPAEFVKEQNRQQGYQPITPDRVDWAQFKQLGITREGLEKSKALDAMLNYRKSPGLIPITLKIGDMTIRTDVRLSLKERPDGTVVPNIHAMRKEPLLNRSFYGNTFTDEDKKALLATGNLGRLLDLKIPGKEDVRAFVSLDRLTNDTVALDTRKVRVPDEVKGVPLSTQQQTELAEGKAIYLEGMTAKNGKSFNANLQLNADKRGIEFQFGNSPKEIQQQQQQPTDTKETTKVLRVPEKLLGHELSPEEREQLKAGKTVYMEGLQKQDGKPFNAHVKPDFAEGRFRFLTPKKEEQKQEQTQAQTPDSPQQKTKGVRM